MKGKYWSMDTNVKRTYANLVTEFSTLKLSEKLVFLSELSTEELRTMLAGVQQAPDDAYIKRWVKFIEETIAKKVPEDREKRLDDLGI